MPLLRHEVAWNPSDIRTLLRRGDIHVLHANRQTGKTTELIRYGLDIHGEDGFRVVSPSVAMSEYADGVWRKIQREFIGVTFGKAGIHKLGPSRMFVPATNLTSLRGSDLPIYVDEWNSLIEADMRWILDSGRFFVAVTS